MVTTYLHIIALVHDQRWAGRRAIHQDHRSREPIRSTRPPLWLDGESSGCSVSNGAEAEQVQQVVVVVREQHGGDRRRRRRRRQRRHSNEGYRGSRGRSSGNLVMKRAMARRTLYWAEWMNGNDDEACSKMDTGSLQWWCSRSVVIVMPMGTTKACAGVTGSFWCSCCGGGKGGMVSTTLRAEMQCQQSRDGLEDNRGRLFVCIWRFVPAAANGRRFCVVYEQYHLISSHTIPYHPVQDMATKRENSIATSFPEYHQNTTRIPHYHCKTPSSSSSSYVIELVSSGWFNLGL